MSKTRSTFLTLLAALALPLSANADLITWTDWTDITRTSATGMMGDIVVEIASSDSYINGPSQTECGTNWWTEPDATDPAYTGGSIDNAPTPCEQVGLDSVVQLTATFSSPVDTLYMAILSAGRFSSAYTVTYDFDAAFSVDSDGVGYWSGGNPGGYTLGAGDTISMNEFHGVLAFNDPITTLTFSTSPNEFWHAFTFGTATSVPEPGTLALFGLGLLGIGAARRRKA